MRLKGDTEMTYDELESHLYKKQNGRCNLCLFKYRIEDMDMDHDYPVSKGGSDDIGNLQLLCRSCKEWKGDRVLEC